MGSKDYNYEEMTTEQHFDILYEEEPETPHYRLSKAKLYQNIRKDARISNADAVQVSRLLNKGQVEEAEQKIEDLLEDGE